ncbi:hypothetical protein [Pseudomonas sp. NPDC089569]|uniref:hypothetical protein n=1 Tax=Pseudomonas sp. NPDC089569 TaxID=3390722 RepID=UPI003CFF89F4
MAFSSDTVELDRESPDVKIKASEDKVIITVEVKSQLIADAYVASLDLFTRVFLAQAEPIPAETISSIVSLMVPKKPVSSTLLREARMLAQAKTEILQSQDWVTSNEIAWLANFSSSNPSSQPNKWKKARRIFALNHESIDYFPLYGLDPAHGFRPYSALESVICVLDAIKDGWGMAFWFASPNTFLGGKLPKDALPDNPSGVLSAAKEEVAGLAHG